MRLCKFTFTIISSLPCLHTFWHAIPTSFYIFNVFEVLFLYFFEGRLHSSPPGGLCRWLSQSTAVSIDSEVLEDNICTEKDWQRAIYLRSDVTYIPRYWWCFTVRPRTLRERAVMRAYRRLASKRMRNQVDS